MTFKLNPTGFLIILCCPVILAFGIRADTQQTTRLVYSETTGTLSSQNKYLVTETAVGFTVELFEKNILRKIISNHTFQTTIEHYKNIQNGDTVTVTKKQNSLLFEGTLNNKKVSEAVTIDEDVWYGSKLLLKDFVVSDKQAIQFYMTKPEKLKAVKFKATKEKLERIHLNGTSYTAVKIRLRIAYLHSIFWKSFFWYRLTDGVLLRSEEVRGLPGTPTTFVKLLEETVM